MLRKKRTGRIIKTVLIIAGAFAAVAGAFAVIMFIRKKAEEEKQREDAIEAEIEALIEDKFAQIEAEEAVGE